LKNFSLYQDKGERVKLARGRGKKKKPRQEENAGSQKRIRDEAEGMSALKKSKKPVCSPYLLGRKGIAESLKEWKTARRNRRGNEGVSIRAKGELMKGIEKPNREKRTGNKKKE